MTRHHPHDPAMPLNDPRGLSHLMGNMTVTLHPATDTGLIVKVSRGPAPALRLMERGGWGMHPARFLAGHVMRATLDPDRPYVTVGWVDLVASRGRWRVIDRSEPHDMGLTPADLADLAAAVTNGPRVVPTTCPQLPDEPPAPLVLVFDDDPLAGRAAASQLTAAGWTVERLTLPYPERLGQIAAQHVLDYAEAETPIIVVCDGLEGHFFPVAAACEPAGVPFVLLSGTSPATLERQARGRPYELVPKPSPRGALEAALLRGEAAILRAMEATMGRPRIPTEPRSV